MENYELNPFEQTLGFPDPCVSSTGFESFDWEKPQKLIQETASSVMEEDEEMVCYNGSRLVPTGFATSGCKEEIVLFINAGATRAMELDSGIKLMEDKFFEGGDTFQTEEFINDGEHNSFIYQSTRLGNFFYRIGNLEPGDYFLDLHFVEIINTNGPKGMRVFNVFVQDEKILSDFDIFSIVGFNKPLQLVDARISVKDDGILYLKFEGIVGSPVVSGICIRRAPKVSVPQTNREYFVCKNCSAEIEYPSAEKKVLRMKSITKYEKTIQDLKDALQRKTDECYQSWMSCSAANVQLDKVKMELDNKIFQTYTHDQTLETQAGKLADISRKYEQDQKAWKVAINCLEQKVKVMKREHSELSREAHECVGSIPNLNKMVSAVQSLVEQCEDLQLKYNEEQIKRRKLYNQVQEAKGNIRVFCRCRPLSKPELTAGCTSVIDFDAAKDAELGVLSNGSTKKIYKFDRVYMPNDDQVDVFGDAAPLVVSVLDGYNVCIFAYGQTGTGKTFTMEGIESNRGVNYRTLEELFKIAKERAENHSYNISVSVLEVYNEQIRDLLAVETSKKLEVKQASEGFHHIPGIVEAKVENIRQVWNVLQAGSSARAVGSNNVNEHSSRSHCMLCITVRANNLITGECMRSKLWLVDLAGSERLAKTDAQGDRLKEAQNINRSLSALGDVISALANKSSHIPYRNSKLTHLLQDSLGGDSKTLMFVQISPSDQDLSETLSSLNFATRVRGVELGPARKQVDTSELVKMKAMLDKARQEMRLKDESVKKLEENLHNLESKTKGKDQVYKSQLDKIKELEGQLEVRASLYCQCEKQVSHLTERLKGKEESCSTLQQKVMDLEIKLKQQEEIQSTAYQNKVKELEGKLKEQQENLECRAYNQKIKELEEKVREQEKQLASKPPSEPLTANNMLVKSSTTPPTAAHKQQSDNKDEAAATATKNEEEHHRVLRSLNAVNRRGSSQGSWVLPKENEARKKRLSRNGEAENSSVVPGSDNSIKGRHARISRPAVVGRAQMARSKTSRDPVHEVKERDSKKRMWTR